MPKQKLCRGEKTQKKSEGCKVGKLSQGMRTAVTVLKAHSSMQLESESEREMKDDTLSAAGSGVDL